MNPNIIQEIFSSIIIKTDSFQSLKLSPNDWIIPSTSNISCIYFYDIHQWSFYKKQTNHIFMNIEQLILSLQKLIEYYPVLTGTLRSIDTDHKVSIDYNNNKGAWIVCQEDKAKIVPTWNLDETDFTISAWNKMRMYSDSDFELGVYSCRIILPRDMKMNGAAILFSTEKHDTSIDVFLGLDMNEMEQLEKNLDFRKYSIH